MKRPAFPQAVLSIVLNKKSHYKSAVALGLQVKAYKYS
jgi:hypothetical protein